MIYGSARITAIDPLGNSFVNDVEAGDLWLFPGGNPHSIQGLGPDGCKFLLVFNQGDFDEFSTFLLSDWFKHPQGGSGQELCYAGVNFREPAGR